MRAAVIDIGSNSIKVLVAERAPDGSPREILSRTLDVRISEGIGSASLRLAAGPMERGAAAAAELASDARRLGAGSIAAVATSAVRDASNGAAFRQMVQSACGVEVRLLSGAEEADLIGRGLATDPALRHLSDFYVFDLGGGSLECLSYRARRAERAASLPLGCVRLTEQLVDDPGRPLGAGVPAAVASRVEAAVAASGFPLPAPAGSVAVGTGGTLTTVRAIEAAARAVPLDKVDIRIAVASIRSLYGRLASADLPSRRSVPGLPAPRADVFPVALATLVALADLGGFDAYQHSLRNLRWGIVAELLGPAP
jgi:exopolyphosphatase/guanosine-5'-triphosphate,3'-diphosphate pyrophosphatase